MLNGASEGCEIRRLRGVHTARTPETEAIMNTEKTSSLKTFLQYLGRGAAMFDGGYGAESAAHRRRRQRGEERRVLGGGRLEDRAVPAAPVQHAGPRLTPVVERAALTSPPPTVRS